MTDNQIDTEYYSPVTPDEEEPSVSEEERVVEQVEKPRDDMSDLFEVPGEDDNDMQTDDLFELEEEDVMGEGDLSDLTSVSREDVMGTPPRPKPKKVLRRTGRPYYTPPASLGGLR